MATQAHPNRSFKFSIPLVFKRRKKDGFVEISSVDYSTVLNELDEQGLNRFCQKILPFLHISGITLADGNDLRLVITVTSEKQLHHFYEASKKQPNGQNLLSRTITDYCYDTSLELSVGNRLKDKLHVFTEMTKTQFGEGMIALDDIEETVVTTKPLTQPDKINQQTEKEELKEIKVKDEVKKIEEKHLAQGSEIEAALGPGIAHYEQNFPPESDIKEIKVKDEVNKIEEKHLAQGSEIEAALGPGIAYNEQNFPTEYNIKEGKKIRKDLRVCLSANDEIPSVVLRSSSKLLDGRSLKPHQKLSNMFTTSISIPESYIQKVYYWYEITFTKYFDVPVIGKWVPKLERSSKTVETERVYFDRELVKRDVFGNDVFKCVANHLYDVIFDSYQGNDSERIKFSIKEIETLLQKLPYYFSRTNFETVIHFLLQGMGPKPNSTEGLYILIVMYRCLVDVEDLKGCKLIQDDLKKILPSLNKIRLSELQGIHTEKMVDLCLILCQITLKEKFCLLSFMDMCYPFLDELHFKNLTSKIVSQRNVLNLVGENGIELIPVAARICVLFANNYLSNEESDVSLALLKRLMLHLPIDYVVNIKQELFKSIKMSESQRCVDLQTQIQETVMNSIKSAIITVKKNKSIEKIEQLWAMVSSVLDLSAEVVTLFESSILEMLEYTKTIMDSSCDAFKRCALSQVLFEDKNKQYTLLTKMSDSCMPKIHSIFICCMKSKKFSFTSKTRMKEVCVAWINRDIETHLKHYKCNIMLAPYYSMKRLLDVESVHADEDTRKAIFQIVFNSLSKNKLKDVLQKLDDETEVRVGSFVFDILRDHVMQMVKTQYKSKEPEEVLGFLCPYGSLRVNTRLTANLVCFLLDGPFNLPDDIHDLELFHDVFKQRKSWTILLKGSGKTFSIIEKNKSFQLAIKCLESVRKKLKRREVTFEFLDRFHKDTGRNEAVELLEANTQDTVLSAWRENEKSFAQKLSSIQTIKTVFIGIKNNVRETELPFGFHNSLFYVNQIEEDIRSKLMTSEIKDKMEVGKMKELCTSCEILQKIAHSQVFWNVSLKSILSNYDNKVCKEDKKDCSEENDDILESLSLLFQTEPVELSRGISNGIVLFLDTVLECGSHCYMSEWNALMKESDYLMSRYCRMFLDCEIEKEIQIAEKFLRTKVKDETKRSLKRLKDLENLQDSVHAMKTSVSSCKLNDSDFFKAVDSFYDFCNGDFSSYTFLEVGQSLSTVFDIAEPLHNETISILDSIGKSSILLEFLYEIVDDDIRNLIDAVEDISEKHVQETTVAALIEVKRFVQPILKNENNMKAEEMFHSIDKQVRSNVEFSSKMPLKVEDCMSNIHNLKSLYNNVANRSEQTKEIILNLVKRGKFTFTLNQEGTDCDFVASYSHKTSGLREKSLHLRAELTDLRSRALLLTNKSEAKGYKGNELDIFVSQIDTCSEITSLILKLHAIGHIKFKQYYKKEDGCNLSQLQIQLESELTKWKQHLKNVRTEYYLANFLQGFEIHKLHTYLIAASLPDHKDHMEAQTLLKNIHPHLELANLKEHFDSLILEEIETDEYLFTEIIGNALHMCLHNFPFYQRCIKSVPTKDKRLADIVQRSKPLLVQLEESSLLVIRTVITLFCNTVQRLPESNQVLFCTKQTRWEEIDLLLSRCQGASDFYNEKVLYCIANVEILSNEIQFELVEAIRNLDQSRNYHLALICRGSRNHPFIDELSEFTCKIRPLTDRAIEEILQNECHGVQTTTSQVAGLGKTTEIVQEAFSIGHSVATLHISGPMTKERIVNGLSVLDLKAKQTLHIDIGSIANASELDTLLFEVIVLRFVTTGKTSVFLETSYVAIEIANSLQDNLRNSLQTAILFKRKHISWHDYENLVVSREINSPMQVVCHFLQNLEKDTIDSTDIFFSGPHSVKPLSAKVCQNLLRKYFPSNSEISFSILNIFLNVLADQLKKMASSSFFRTSRIRDMIGHKTKPNIRSSLLQALVDVSREFSCRSVNACRSTQKSTLSDSSEGGTADEVTQRVESMIRWEDSNHLMYVFHNQNIQTLSPIYRDRTKVPSNIKTLFESQMKKEMQDYKKMDQKQLQIILQKICRSKALMLQEEKLDTLSKDYALTPDNLLKMILIMLRVKSGIPVLVMGETGCGKTSLIRYLANICEVQFDVLNIHAGVGEGAIEEKVLNCNEMAIKQSSDQFWLFFDEINTSEYVGLISDIICHHSFLGKKLAPNLVVMGACNPYKLRSSSAILTAGLKGRAKTDHLSRLVYRVLPLPEMVIDYVWDFGSLNDVDEKVYIHQMVNGVIPYSKDHHKLLTELLSMSQAFIRCQEVSSCCVSLRDVQRCKVLLLWFLDALQKKTLHKSSYSIYDKRDRAIILALAHCYHSRISDTDKRKMYRESVSEVFKASNRSYSEVDVYRVIIEEQEDILNRMDLPLGTAKNTALRENVFLLLVSILNKIPIFVVGKPGCSKSLSMQVIRSNLRGQDSKDEFFKTLPQLYCVSFQGSESSTSDGIIKVFEKAERYQETNHADSVLSVVILDEIGLAEVSRFNPLKVLHNLLEPDGKDRPNVAVVGISNWSLDASKMNRAIHLSRPDMGVEELFETGKSISDSFVQVEKSNTKSHLFSLTQTVKTSSFRTSLIESELEEIAHSYFTYTANLRFQNFHGLRDFYSLVKYFAREIAASPEISLEEKRQVMLMGLERNFGGLPEERHQLVTHFQVRDIKFCCPVVDLIKENVQDPIARHLMLITSGESVIGILDKSLDDVGRQDREIIFGSQFEEDLTDDYNYRILNRIILCMEQGLILILKDLENIYGSLYDMLNQNYTVIGKKKNCRVALGPYSNPICQVAESFRCIVLVDESKLPHSDPPFLNRFEKQYLRFADSISKDHSGIINKVDKWVSDLSVYEDFDESDAFPIFSKDMVTSLVLKNFSEELDEEEIIQNCKRDLLLIVYPEAILRLTGNDDKMMQYEASSYLELPVHNGMKGFIESEMFVNYQGIKSLDCQMNIIFTKSNIHTKVLLNVPNFQIQIEKLAVFKSEKQLASRMQAFWLESDSDILFVQCSAVDDEKHIMLAKSTIEKFRQEFLKTKADAKWKHVFLIIHLDSNKGVSSLLTQINFMINWRLVTIDSLEIPNVELPLICRQSLHDALMMKKPLNHYIKEQLFWAFTRIKYLQVGRDVQQLTSIMAKIGSSETFLSTLESFVIAWITKNHKNIDDDTSWQFRVACDRRALQTSSCFLEALDVYILNVIDGPLVKYLYVLEKQNMIETFFVEDENYKERIFTWINLVTNEDEFCIRDIPDNFAPESYICNTQILDQRMPFSRYIFENVEETMDEFIDTIKILKGKCGLDPDEDLPYEIVYELQKKQELIIYQKLPRIVHYNYTSAAVDYFNDFCCLKLAQIFHSCDDIEIHDYMKFILSEKVNEVNEDLLKAVTTLHIAFWSHSSLMTPQLQLFATCRHLFSEEDLLSLKQRKDDYTHKKESDSEEIHSSDDESCPIVGTKLDTDKNEPISRRGNVSDHPENSDEVFTINDTEADDQMPDENFVERTVNLPDQHSQNFIDMEGIQGLPEFNTDFPELGESMLEDNLKPTDKELPIEIENHVKEEIFQESKESEFLGLGFKKESPEEFHEEEWGYSRADNPILESEGYFEKLEVINKQYSISDLSNEQRIEEVSPQMAIKPECKLEDSHQDEDSNYDEKYRVFDHDNKISSQADEEIEISGSKVLCVVEDQSQSEGEESNTDPKDALVQIVCERMLPTDYSVDISEWSISANKVLSLVVKVNPGSKFIHHLRICTDIVTSVVIPYKVDLNLLYSFADKLLTDRSLDTDSVYDALQQILTQTSAEALPVCQRILSGYFIRCLLSDPESTALDFFLESVCTNALSCSNSFVFKTVWSLAIQYQLDQDEDCLLKFLRQEKIFDKDQDETDDELCQDSHFLLKLDETVIELLDAGDTDCPYIIMLIDAIEDVFTEYISENESEPEVFSEILGDLMHSHHILTKSSELNLQYVVATGFYKACLNHIVKGQSDKWKTNEKTLEYMKAILSDHEKRGIVKTVQSYFMKLIGYNEISREKLKQIFEMKDAFTDFDEKFPYFAHALIECSVDSCPLLIYLDKADHDDFQALLKQEKDDLDSTVKEYEKKTKHLVLFAAYCEMKFSIPRSHSALNDHLKTLSLSFSKCLKESNISTTAKFFFNCLIGTVDFRIESMNSSEQTSSDNCLLNGFLVSLLTLWITYDDEKYPNSFFLKCLACPIEIDRKYLPGVASNGEFESARFKEIFCENNNHKFFFCECYQRGSIKTLSEETLNCPECLKPVHLEENYFDNLLLEESMIGKEDLSDSMWYSTRDLSPLACQVLFLITKGCLLGSLALRKALPEHLEELLRTSPVDIPHTLWKEALLHWTNIGELLGVEGQTVGFFLQNILKELQDLLFNNCPQMVSAEERLSWENNFNSRIEYVYKKRFELQEQMLEHLRSLNGQKNELEDTLLEIGTGKDEYLATLFRIKGSPSYGNFVQELNQFHDKFMLLKLIIQVKDKLTLPSHIKPIVQWHMTVISTVNYVMRKQDCLDMTVTEFMKQIGDKEKSETIGKRYDEMKQSWSFLKKTLNKSFSDKMVTFHFKSKMADCVMHTEGCVMYKVLEHIAGVQNDFLDLTLSISARCESLSFLLRSGSVSMLPCVKIEDVTKSHLLQFKVMDPTVERDDGGLEDIFDWEAVIQDNSQSDTSYGHGQKIWYDFYAIQRLLAQRLVPGKAHILCSYHELPKIVFTDELYKNYVSLSDDVRSKVKQIPLSSDLISSVHNKHREDRRMCSELMIQIGMIMTLLNKTGGDPDRCLIDYVEDMKNVLTKKFSDNLLPSPSVKLGHVVSLYEVLEELNAESIMDALGDEFKTELELDHRTMLKSLVKTKKRIASSVLHACKRFVTRCLSLQEANATVPLVEYLVDVSFWPEGVCNGNMLKVGGDEVVLDDIFPKQVMVEHITGVVTAIETEFERIKEESNQTSKLAATFKSSQGSTPVSANTRRRTTATKKRKTFAV